MLAPGDVLDGKFRIERLLGQGGMGAVVAARHIGLDQRVAIKVLHEQVATDRGVVERLVREARAAARLRSEHVCRVSDVGEANGTPYIVMELLEGSDLARVIERAPLPVATAVDYVLQACVALAEAHALGIIHRDLKPANLFVTQRLDGSPLVKVLDFGIAKAPAGGVALTQTETMMGTPGYMSPEQLRSTRDVDARTDIWALGVILYQAVSGRLPFPATSITEVAVKIAMDPPEPLDGAVDARFRELVFRCLEKEPAKRPRDVSVLAKELVPLGGPTAAANAALIEKLLAASVAHGDTLVANAATVATAVSERPKPPTTTLERASGEPTHPATRDRRISPALLLGSALALAGVGVAGWALTRRPHDEKPTIAASAPTPAVVAPISPPQDAAPTEPAVVPVDAPVKLTPKAKPKQRSAPMPQAAPEPPPPPPTPTPADLAEVETRIDQAIARKRCNEARALDFKAEREHDHKPADVFARLDKKTKGCLDQRQKQMRNPDDPQTEAWVIVAAQEMRDASDNENAQILLDNYYYGRVIDACQSGDAERARKSVAKMSSTASTRGFAIKFCAERKITLE